MARMGGKTAASRYQRSRSEDQQGSGDVCRPVACTQVTSERPPSSGNAFCYVLPCHVEELLKIGFSTNPLRRFETFHSRYYDVFDLDRGFLIETDRIVEAREIEGTLMRDIDAHNAPAPATIRPGAAGDTEWYRGAYAHALATGSALARSCGYALRRPLRDWLRQQLMGQAPLLYEWSAHAFALLAADHVDLRTDAVAQRFSRQLIDRVDAYAALGIEVGDFVTASFHDWYRSRARV